MVLTQKQIDDLNKVVNKLPMQRLRGYASDGTITADVLAKLTSLNSERRAELLAIINAPKPNPQERQEWDSILPQLKKKDETALQLLTAYVEHWEKEEPLGNHLSEARQLMSQITALIEDKDWDALDKSSDAALLDYLKKYAQSSHRPEIDNYLWTTVESKADDIEARSAARIYLQTFPQGMYVEEAKELLKPAVGSVPAGPVDSDVAVPPLPADMQELDIIGLWEWMAGNPYSELYDAAAMRLQELKTQEFSIMREQSSAYSGDRIFYLIEKGIISEGELFNTGMATPESLNILRERDDILESLPDINAEIAKCRQECADNRTDVFLFGIPSTGKTCILMGLIGSPNIDINTVRAGGPYACVLQQFLDAGLTIGQTPKDFIATIQAEIHDGDNRHLLNLVEMAGEDFAFKIADNEEGKVSFEDIGAGATKLLCNNNKKAFFIIVDPTAKRVAFNHLVNETGQDGVVRTYLVRRNVNQKIILKRLVDLLCQPENKKILKNVDAINIVISKADILGTGKEREEEAYRRFMEQHQNIIAPLIRLCRENNINVKSNGQPMLYTFSLGRFYVGGVYQYDPTDANNLVEVLKATRSTT